MSIRTRITLVVVFGAWTLFAFFYLVPRSFTDTTKWPSTKGKIVESRITKSSTSRKHGSRSGDYELHLTYDYVVGGKSYQATKRSLLDSPVYESFSRETLARLQQTEYAIGNGMTVHYDSKNPSRAVLDTTPPNSFRKIAFIIFGSFGCLGVLVGLFGKKVHEIRRS